MMRGIRSGGVISMKSVLILGAGVSLAEAMIWRPSRRSNHPPLDANFFSKAQAIAPAEAASFSTRAEAMGLPPIKRGVELGMENVFGDLYYAVHSTSGSEHNQALMAYRQLLRLYTRVLAQTTNWFCDRSHGLLQRYLELHLAQSDDLTIVTFNHDLGAENALSNIPRTSVWCVERGYGPIALRPVAVKGLGRGLPLHSSACDHSTPVQLLKLHGSLNWQVATRSHQPSEQDLFPSTQRTSELSCIAQHQVSLSLTRRSSRRRYRLWPQVVPPIYDKQGIIAARFGALWTAASSALAEAEHVALVGYSIPPADVHAANMIKQAFRKNDLDPHVEVINPDPHVATRLADLTALPAITWIRSLRDQVETWEDM